MRGSFFSAILVCAAASSLCLTACNKTSSATKTGSTQGLSSADSITSFTFLTANNAVSVNSSSVIAGNSITVFLPPGTVKTALKASFTVSSGSEVIVNATPQTSGTSANDFTDPVAYLVKAPNGSTQTYTVNLVTDIATIDQKVNNFMTTYSIPGLSLAITYNENLVYVKGYGKAELDNNEPVVPHSLFRLASLSKQITSITLMLLMDQGKVHLEDSVFGTNGILGTTFGTQPYGPNITSITIDELLHHTSGGWPNDGTDPMFTNPTLTADQLISWTLDNRPLLHVPGSTYAYSNFGFCILGRVIEKITGRAYVDAVNALVLQPLGIKDMAIAGNTLAQRANNEVEYYGQSGEDPYIYNITRMDSHGGWIASATDLAWILTHIDGFPVKPDILSSNAETVMTTPSTANANYACGWAVNSSNNWWHQGSLPGTATEQARTISQGKYNFVILTNTRNDSNDFSSGLDDLFWQALASTPLLPTYDLFGM